jgi:hypothetical protein
MYQTFNRYKILRVFFDEPNRNFHLRELERITTISLPSVKHHVEILWKSGFLQKVKNGVYHSYKASLNDAYRRLKSNDLLIRLEECGLIKAIGERCTPNCIVLYGSGVEGRDDERGDIDLFIQSKEQKIDIRPYEKSLKRKISLLFEPSMDKLESGFKNTLANGLVLRGFLKVI